MNSWRCAFINSRRRSLVIIVCLVIVIATKWSTSYVALFAWLVASGLGMPPGEDSLVAGIGAIAASGELTRWIAMPMAVLAVVISDTLLFSGGRVARSAMSDRATWLSDWCNIEAFVGRREALAIAVARFVPGLRTLVFMALGARGLSRRRFLLIDTCAAAMWVPIIMICGAAVLPLIFGEDAVSLEAWI